MASKPMTFPTLHVHVVKDDSEDDGVPFEEERDRAAYFRRYKDHVEYYLELAGMSHLYNYRLEQIAEDVKEYSRPKSSHRDRSDSLGFSDPDTDDETDDERALEYLEDVLFGGDESESENESEDEENGRQEKNVVADDYGLFSSDDEDGDSCTGQEQWEEEDEEGEEEDDDSLGAMPIVFGVDDDDMDEGQRVARIDYELRENRKEVYDEEYETNDAFEVAKKATEALVVLESVDCDECSRRLSQLMRLHRNAMFHASSRGLDRQLKEHREMIQRWMAEQNARNGV